MLVYICSINIYMKLANVCNPANAEDIANLQGRMWIRFKNNPPEIGKTYKATNDMEWVYDNVKDYSTLTHGHISTEYPIDKMRTYFVH